MSSIAIPLQTQVPQSQGPLQSIGQLLQTRDLGSQIALRRAQTQEYQAQADQKQRDLSDQNIVQQSMQDPAANAKLHTGDFSPIEGKVQPKTLAAIQKNYADAQTALLAHTKEQNEERLGALQELNSSVAGLKQLGDLGAINSALPQLKSQLAQSGVLKRAGLTVAQLPDSIQDPKQIDLFLAANGGLMAAHGQALAQQKTQADIAEASGKGAASISEANIKDRQLANMTPGGLLPDEKVKADQAAAALAHEQSVATETRRHDTADEAAARQRAAIEGGSLNLRQKEFEQNYGAPGDNSTVQGLAKALIDGKISTADVRRMKGGQAAISAAIAQDDTWSEQRYQTMKNFENGPDAKNLSQLNMLSHHLDSFGQASENEGTRVNPYSGNAAKLATVANDVSGVMGNLVKGGALTVTEHKEYMDRLNSILQGRRDATVGEMKELIGGKIDAIKQKYKNGTGRDLPDSFLGAGAKLSGTGNGKIIDHSTAQQYYQKAGGDPAKARQMAVQDGWKVQ